MPTKEMLAEELNETLGTEIEWQRMRKDDLKEFKQLVDSGDLIVLLGKEYAKDASSKKVENVVDEWEPGKIAAKLI